MIDTSLKFGRKDYKNSSPIEKKKKKTTLVTGWSGIDVEEQARDSDGTSGESLGRNEFLANLKSGTASSSLFDNFLKDFLKESGALDSVKFFPPMLADGRSLNLLKLLLVVRERGGNGVVCRDGLWNSVAEDLELDSSFGPTLKLVYVEYLFDLEKKLESLVVDKDLNQKLRNSGGCEVSMSSGDKLNGILSEMQKLKYSELESDCSPSMEADSVYGEQYSSYTDSARSTVDGVEPRKSIGEPVNRFVMDSSICGDNNNNNKSKYVDESMPSGSSGSMKVGDEEDVKSAVVGTDEMDKGSDDEGADDMDCDKNVVEEPVSSRKRKRGSKSEMLNWLYRIARNPCDLTVEQLPDKSKWKLYGSEKLWKQVLLAREELFDKRDVMSSPASNGQENRKMHPCMYEDHIGTNYNFRERSKCKNNLAPPGARLSKKGHTCRSYSSLTTHNGSDSYTQGACGAGDSSLEYYSFVELPAESAIPVGPAFQAAVPEWIGGGVASESETRWLGTRVWPPLSLPSKLIIEREPIGKGRVDSCGCEVPKSVECVRFHIKERRLKLKRELGKAFYDWSFDRMGEEVKANWSEDEEKRFMAIVSGVNLPSSGRCFWDEIIKQFPRKRREDLVSYYYNVCLLCRRAYQNRFTPSGIRSDDDDSEEDVDESGLRVNGSSRHSASILGSAKKSRKKR
ncbi:unnamed protein product [Linum tenue]|uniref:ARID domain-containing protein n=1 Tax=Linum tenue TaxID=586396 RepID=A0AAV0PNC3_9ROSI|nr:unnamed protein product [Linum tenue]